MIVGWDMPSSICVHCRTPRRLTWKAHSLNMFPTFPLNFSKLPSVVRMWSLVLFDPCNFFIHVSPIGNNILLQRFNDLFVGKFPGTKAFSYMFLRKIFLIIRFRMSDYFPLIHICSKKRLFFRISGILEIPRRKYENQVGANFHFGVKYLYQSNETIHMLGYFSSCWQFKGKASNEMKHLP